ncbi:hypothetical protein PV328_006286 [Microctonus aethiopoides]|uniref:Uncharacterized protein n=1 Tax=Microctonus aethiopoides TaxID=144406 RepID=A0AA39FNS8_9HYME|nr:hypothetical protein PV328_006286 [Microctonus aethiopoides]
MSKSKSKLIVNSMSTSSSPLTVPKFLSTEPSIKSQINEPPNQIKNVAVHFGNFYEQKINSTTAINKQTNQPLCEPKLEFTLNMVRKLEQSTGNVDYSRQVTALLDNTVEPPNFSVLTAVTEENIHKNKLNINQDNFVHFTNRPIPTDEWDSPVDKIDSEIIQQNRRIMGDALKKYWY